LSNSIKFQVRDKVAYISMNRPEKRNAMDAEMVEEIYRVLTEADEDDKIRAIIFSGEGSTFCSGADLDYLLKVSKSPVSSNIKDSENLANLFREIYQSRKLTCAVVRGAALAGGFGLALACDVVFASEKAKFGFTEVKIGFVPAIAMNFALRKLRESDMRKLVLTGAIIDAQEAMRLGVVSEIIDDDEINSHVQDFLREFVSKTSRGAITLTKEMLTHVHGLTFDEALKYSVNKNVEARFTSDFKKGIESFLNKKNLEWE
jgi:methylglutaconyl-CoA hydratase